MKKENEILEKIKKRIKQLEKMVFNLEGSLEKNVKELPESHFHQGFLTGNISRIQNEILELNQMVREYEK